MVLVEAIFQGASHYARGEGARSVERAATVIGNGTPEEVKAVKAGEAGPKAALATLEAAVVDTSGRIPQCALGQARL